MGLQLVAVNWNLSPWQAILVIAAVLGLLWGLFAVLIAIVVPHFFPLGG